MHSWEFAAGRISFLGASVRTQTLGYGLCNLKSYLKAFEERLVRKAAVVSQPASAFKSKSFQVPITTQNRSHKCFKGTLHARVHYSAVGVSRGGAHFSSMRSRLRVLINVSIDGHLQRDG